MLLSAIKDTINLNEMTVVHFNEAYILVQILIVYLDGDVRIDMILKMIIFCKLLSMKIHRSFITYSFYGMDIIR
ncbi:hypothetical protein [Paenibacillus sp. LjRoot153]|uniref:hypothetical protein n=1 Tax=Paenibacillus sp. LjRoot153 TaxID=3342270 RepID=UPI003F4FD74E